MNRKLYIFNRETRQFEEHRPSALRRAALLLKYLLGSVAAAVLLYCIAALFYSDRGEKALIAENEYLQSNYRSLLQRSQMVDDVLEGLSLRDGRIYNSIFETDPPQVDALYSEDDPDILEKLYGGSESQMIAESAGMLQDLEETADAVDRQIRAIEDRLCDDNFNKNNFPSVIPLSNFTIAQTGATVGEKVNPFYKTLRRHTGIDLMAPYGTPVTATAAGVVVEVLKQNKGLGNMVVIDHGGALRTVYAHLSDVDVGIGRRVERGSVIGKVGSSGASFTACLHYEVQKGGRAVDPVNYFFAAVSPSVYAEMLLVAGTTGQSLD